MNTGPALRACIEQLYAEGHSAYGLPPIVASRNGNPVGRIRPGDSVVFCCRRGEREVQLTEAFTDPAFSGFPRSRLSPLTFVPLVSYHPMFDHLPTAFPSRTVDHTLGETVSRAGLRQLRLAEREKLAHVTYFMNGRRSEPFSGESVLAVASNLEDPLSSLPSLCESVCTSLRAQQDDLVVVNVASGDILGHSDCLETKKACAHAVDLILGDILQAARQSGYTSIITADHGLLEEHGVPEGSPNTSHTTHPVPFLFLPPEGLPPRLRESGSLADVAPTVLQSLGLESPNAMSGSTLLETESIQPGKTLLLILDGWGLPESGHINPIELAQTPTWDALMELPMSSLEASGVHVGLLPGRNGNSESGHMTIGAGRRVSQDDVRIAQSIEDGSFASSPAMRQAFQDAVSRRGSMHLIAMLSRTSSHGSFEYAIELCRHASANGFERVFVHTITDGRSSKSARLPHDLEKAAQALQDAGCGKIVTLVGRGLALDRGRDYEKKTRPAYEAMVMGMGLLANVDR